MPSEHGTTATPARDTSSPYSIPPDFLRAIAVWSLIPSYLAAAALIGYLLDRWLGWFPYITGGALILGLVLATRDMLRLRDMM